MKVSFAVLAWNEAQTIRQTIESIARQCVVTDTPSELEHLSIAVVVNGSTDGTSQVARQAFQDFFDGVAHPRVSYQVYELPEPNRAAAWNAFVHEYSDDDCDFIGFMDADIKLLQPDTLANLIAGLHEHPHAFASAAKTIKDIKSKKRKSLRDRLSLLGTDMEKKARLAFLAGQLYLGRAGFWRRFYVPYGMCADDSMFTVLAWTNFKREPIDPTRVFECDNAPYEFEAYLKLSDIYRQHRRRSIGGLMHQIIWEYSSKTKRPDEDVGNVMTREFAQDPYWLVKLLQARVQERGIRSMQWRVLNVRLTQLRVQPWYKKILLFPFSLLFTVWSFFVLIGAYRVLKSGKFRSLWTKATSVPSVIPMTEASR